MYTLPTSNYRSRELGLNRHRSYQPVAMPQTHRHRVLRELRELGVTKAGLLTLESQHLPAIIHSGEHLRGIVYGHHEAGHAMLVATDWRVIFLDKKPLFTDQDDINFGVVAGVNYGRGTFASTITLHTRIKDYAIRTFNRKCAEGFVRYIEDKIEHPGEREKLNWPGNLR